jgi:predicted dehydrogenase
MEDPRLCVVGAGSHATRRIYPYLGAAGAQLVGVCDVDREQAERNARRFAGKPYDALESMLAAEHPDGVIVCIGPSAHAERAPIVMRRGIPVYTEQPPAATAAGARAVARISQETGVLCTTAFKKRGEAVRVARAPHLCQRRRQRRRHRPPDGDHRLRRRPPRRAEHALEHLRKLRVDAPVRGDPRFGSERGGRRCRGDDAVSAAIAGTGGG